MAEIVLLRHSKTYGNTLGRYIGSRTDEPLCEEGMELLKYRAYPQVDKIYTSPMKRCIETAQLIWGGIPEHMIRVPELRECDFGDFENKNYKELDGNPDYQAWIDSNGTLPFPNGESMEAFMARCQKAFEQIVEEVKRLEKADRKGASLRIAIVAHGGTIMSILERYGYPQKQYFDYQVKNGCGYLLMPVEGTELWNYRYLP